MTVIDVNEADFEAEVLDRSSEIPVVVDFWAPWCAPCRALGPSLEKAAAAREGKIVLAKIDTDENPRLSELFGIQGIPAVKAFQNGEVVAEFVGGLPPAQVERFFDGLVPSEAQLLMDAGDEASLRKALELDPKNVDASFALAQMLYRAGDTDGALALVDTTPATSAPPASPRASSWSAIRLPSSSRHLRCSTTASSGRGSTRCSCCSPPRTRAASRSAASSSRSSTSSASITRSPARRDASWPPRCTESSVVTYISCY